MLEDDEAVATMLGLRLAAAGGTGIEDANGSAERAATKLRRILPAALRRRTDEVIAAVEIGRTQHPQVEPSHLQLMASAISDHRCVSFGYQALDRPSVRTVEPVRLVQLRQRWYLYGWDRQRQDWRNFRLDRITDPQRTDVTFRPRPLPADDLAAHIQEGFHGPQTLRAVLVLHASARESAARLHRIDGTLESLDEQSCRYVAHVDSFEWLATVLTLTDIEFQVEEPTEFRDHLAGTAQRLLRATQS
jgi:predicted DNA-binding transcriptional regulator YafY